MLIAEVAERVAAAVVARLGTDNSDPVPDWLDSQLPAHGRQPGRSRRESVDEIAFLLGHRDANVTRAVYVRELADARRRTMRRSRMLAEFSDILQP